MAEGKNKIVVYADWLDNFEDLTDEELGKLMRHFFMYVNDMDPVLEDRLLNIAWKPIQATLKRDLKKWESFVEKQKANGKKGGRPKTQKTQALNEEPKKAVSVSVSDSVINNNMLMVELIKNQNEHSTYIESLYMRKKLKQGSLGKLLKEYNLNLGEQGVNHIKMQEYKKHFSNWLNTMERLGNLSIYQR